MKWAVIIVRTLLGFGFTAIALAHIFKLMEPQPFPNETVEVYMTKVLAPTGYLDIVKVLELVGGVMLLTGFFVPLGITILTPVIVNILIFGVCLAHQPAPGVVMMAMAAFLIAGYWQHFKSVLAMRATISCC